MEKIVLVCEHCGGVLEADASRKILSCPYCGKKALVVESDAVKIAELEADVKKFKIQSDENVEMVKVNKNLGHKVVDYFHEKEETKQKQLELEKARTSPLFEGLSELIMMVVLAIIVIAAIIIAFRHFDIDLSEIFNF